MKFICLKTFYTVSRPVLLSKRRFSFKITKMKKTKKKWRGKKFAKQIFNISSSGSYRFPNVIYSHLYRGVTTHSVILLLSLENPAWLTNCFSINAAAVAACSLSVCLMFVVIKETIVLTLQPFFKDIRDRYSFLRGLPVFSSMPSAQ